MQQYITYQYQQLRIIQFVIGAFMNFDPKKCQQRKILSATLYQMEDILNNKQNLRPSYKNMTFQFICFVARLVKKDEICQFTDDTGVFSYDSRKIFNISEIKVGHYYECLCKFTRINTSFIPQILNLKEIQGNLITTHFIKVITQQIQYNISSNSQRQTVDENQYIQKTQQIYSKMREWAKSKYNFSLQQLQSEFMKVKQGVFNALLAKLQDEGVIGNMGDCYEYINIE